MPPPGRYWPRLPFDCQKMLLSCVYMEGAGELPIYSTRKIWDPAWSPNARPGSGILGLVRRPSQRGATRTSLHEMEASHSHIYRNLHIHAQDRFSPSTRLPHNLMLGPNRRSLPPATSASTAAAGSRLPSPSATVHSPLSRKHFQIVIPIANGRAF